MTRTLAWRTAWMLALVLVAGFWHPRVGDGPEGLDAATQRSETFVQTTPGLDGSEVAEAVTEGGGGDGAASPERVAAPGERFLRLLDGLETGETARPVRVFVLGDSHTASDTWTAPFRRALTARFGDAGRGYAHPGSPWRHFRQRDMTYAQSSGWEVHQVASRGFDGPAGVGGLRLTSAPGVRASLSRGQCASCRDEVFEVTYVHHRTGGTFSLDLTEGDAVRTPRRTVQTGTSEAAPFLGTVRLPRVEGLPARLVLQTHGDGAVHIVGVSSLSERPGIRVESLGLNGARMSHFLQVPEALFVADLAERAPDLVVLAFGTNEAFADSYGPAEPSEARPHPRLVEHGRALVERVRRAAPEADCLLLLPPDLIPTRDAPRCVPTEVPNLREPVCIASPPGRFGVVQASLREVAASSGCLVWDFQAAMGGPGSMRVWMARSPALGAPDGVHLTTAGYEAAGEGLVRDLLEALQEARAGAAPALRTSAVTPEHLLLPGAPTEGP